MDTPNNCKQTVKQELDAMTMEEYEVFLKKVTGSKSQEDLTEEDAKHAALLKQLEAQVKVQADEPLSDSNATSRTSGNNKYSSSLQSLDKKSSEPKNVAGHPNSFPSAEPGSSRCPSKYNISHCSTLRTINSSSSLNSVGIDSAGGGSLGDDGCKSDSPSGEYSPPKQIICPPLPLEYFFNERNPEVFNDYMREVERLNPTAERFNRREIGSSLDSSVSHLSGGRNDSSLQLSGDYPSVASLTTGGSSAPSLVGHGKSTHNLGETIRSLTPNFTSNFTSPSVISKSPSEGSNADRNPRRGLADRSVKKKVNKSLQREHEVTVTNLPGYRGNDDLTDILNFVEGLPVTRGTRARKEEVITSKTPTLVRKEDVGTNKTPTLLRKEDVSTSKTPNPVRKEEVSTTKTPTLVRKEDASTSKTATLVRKEDVSTSKTPTPVRKEEISTSKTPIPGRKEDASTTKTPTPGRKEDVSSSKTPTPVRKEEVSTSKTPTPVRKEDVSTNKTPTPVRKEEVSTSKTPTPVRKEEVITSKTPTPVRKEEVKTSKTPTTVRREAVNSNKTSSAVRKEEVTSIKPPFSVRKEEFVAFKGPTSVRKDEDSNEGAFELVQSKKRKPKRTYTQTQRDPVSKMPSTSELAPTHIVIPYQNGGSKIAFQDENEFPDIQSTFVDKNYNNKVNSLYNNNSTLGKLTNNLKFVKEQEIIVNSVETNNSKNVEDIRKELTNSEEREVSGPPANNSSTVVSPEPPVVNGDSYHSERVVYPESSRTRGTSVSSQGANVPVVFCGGNFEQEIPSGHDVGFEFGFGVLSAMEQNTNDNVPADQDHEQLGESVDQSDDGTSELEPQDYSDEGFREPTDHFRVMGGGQHFNPPTYYDVPSSPLAGNTVAVPVPFPVAVPMPYFCFPTYYPPNPPPYIPQTPLEIDDWMNKYVERVYGLQRQENVSFYRVGDQPPPQ